METILSYWNIENWNVITWTCVFICGYGLILYDGKFFKDLVK